MSKFVSKKDKILAIIGFSLGFALLLFAIFFIPNANSIGIGDEEYISGKIQLENHDILTFKTDENGYTYAYISYVNKFNDTLVKKLVVKEKDNLTFDFIDQKESTFNYKSVMVNNELYETELYIVVGNDLKNRISGIDFQN